MSDQPHSHAPGAREIDQTGSGTRRLTRRTALRVGLLALAAIPVATACGPSAAPAPAKSQPAAPKAEPTAAPKAAESKPAAAPAESKPAETKPAAPAAQAAPGAPKAKINGKLSVVVDVDFYPEHNKLVEAKVREFADKMGYPLDFSTVAFYLGQANLSQRLMAAVQAGDPPDVICHTEKPSALKFLDVIDDVDELQKDIIKQHGTIYPSLERTNRLDGKWWAISHFTRANGYWARETPFKAAGIDIRKDIDTWDKLRDACVKASKDDLYGWGMTVNRSGDGESVIREIIMANGGQLTDESGQVVMLNKEPYRKYVVEALDWLKATYTDPAYAKMLPPGVNAWTDPSNNEAYLAGKVFYTYNAGTMFAKAMVDKNPVAEDSYLLLPPSGSGPGGRLLANGGPVKRWMIIKGARNREASEQLIRYMLSQDVQREMFKLSTGYVYPAYEWGWDEPIIKEGRAAEQVAGVWKQYLSHPSGYFGETAWPGPPSPWSSALDSSNFWTDLMGEVLTGKSSEDAVKSAHDRAVRVFKEFGAKGE